MKVSFEGREWRLELDHLSYRQALGIQDQAGLSISEWEDSLFRRTGEDGQPLHPKRTWLTSLAALYWLMLVQNGEDADPDGLDFDFSEFIAAFYRALEAEVAALKAAAGPDPTVPSPAPDGPPSSTPPGRTATTRTPRASKGGGPTAST